MRPFGLVVSILLVAGCASQAEQAAKAEQDMQRRMATYGTACEKAGFQRDTDPWRLCVVNYSPHAHH